MTLPRLAVLAAAYLLLASAGAVRAQTPDYDAGLGAYASGDYAGALAQWRPLAEQGIADAQYGLGEMYELGRGVAADPDSASQWYQRAAEQGSARAQAKLGTMFATGLGVPVDLTAAVTWWRKAAQQGSAAAQMRLGEAYHKGEGVDRDLDQAEAWYKRAADAGISAARVGLFEVGKEREREARAAADAGIAGQTQAADVVRAAEPTAQPEPTAAEAAQDAVADGVTAGQQAAEAPPGESSPSPEPVRAAKYPGPHPMVRAMERTVAALAEVARAAQASRELGDDDPLRDLVALGAAVVLSLDAEGRVVRPDTGARDGGGATLAATAAAPAAGEAHTAEATPTEPANATPDTAEVAPSETADAQPTTGTPAVASEDSVPSKPTFRIWLASFHREADAREAWTRLSQNYGDVLGSLEPFIEPAPTASGTLYRVQAGPFDSALAAQAACATLGNRSAYCVAIAP